MRCGEDRWHAATTRSELFAEFERKTTTGFQQELAQSWRRAELTDPESLTLALKHVPATDLSHRSRDAVLALPAIRRWIPSFDPENRGARSLRNKIVALLRGLMQRVALRHLEPDLVILDEVQRFREVLDEADNPEHIAAQLFARRVPVLILSATPYRALTLGHELSEGGTSHHQDFFRTLDFLFDKDRVTPARIRKNMADFGCQLQKPDLAERLNLDVLKLKRELEEDLTRVICRTERNRYVIDGQKGVDDTADDSGALPTRGELEEFFRLHRGLPSSVARGQVTEFWKSAPSLLTFLDGNYQLLKKLREEKIEVPRTLLTSASEVSELASRNHRISRVVDVSLGKEGNAPRLWTSPSYTYYGDEFFGANPPRKLLVFSGWRFVPKTVAVIASGVAQKRLGQQDETPRQPLRFSDRRSFHVFDVCFASPLLADVGRVAYQRALGRTASDVLDEAEAELRNRFIPPAAWLTPGGGDPMWQVVMAIEGQNASRADRIEQALGEWVENDREEGASEAAVQHRDWAGRLAAPGNDSANIGRTSIEALGPRGGIFSC
jgi:hypothetical protein